MAGQHPHIHPDIQAPPVQGVVHALIGIFQPPLPELNQLTHQGVVHVISENLPQLCDQSDLIRRSKQIQGALIDLKHPQSRTALRQQRGIGTQIGFQVIDPLFSPALEQSLQGTVVLQP